MQLDMGIVSTCRCPDGLYTIPDVLNTLTHQSINTNDAPRDPLPWIRYMPRMIFNSVSDTTYFSFVDFFIQADTIGVNFLLNSIFRYWFF